MTNLTGRALAHAAADAALSAGSLGTAPPSWIPSGPPSRTRSGISVVQLRQTHGGVPVLGGVRSVRFDTLGRITDFTGRTVPVAPAVPMRPVLDSRSAAHAAAGFLAGQLDGARPDITRRVSNRRPRVLFRGSGPEGTTTFRKIPFREPVTASLAVRRNGSGLVWVVRFRLPDHGAAWSVLVDAEHHSPQAIEARQTSGHAVSSQVFLHDPSIVAQNVTFDDHWCRDRQLIGNSVYCLDDAGQSLTAVANNGDLHFVTNQPLGLQQAMVNAFYAANYCHDFFFQLGFTPQEGNFYWDDPVYIKILPFGIDGLASFRTPVDGYPPELELGTLGERHSALDVGVVIHEYAHGVTDRMVNGPDYVEEWKHPQHQALDEGFSDYFAITIQNWLRRIERLDPTYVYGGWIAGDWQSGLRNFAYDGTFRGTYGNLGQPYFDTAHDAGQVWCAALLELNQVLALGEGPALGDERGWWLVFDSLRLLHSGDRGPTFLDARDAVLCEFDAAVAEGHLPDSTELKQAVRDCFSRRGMGPGAQSPSPGWHGIVEDLS